MTVIRLIKSRYIKLAGHIARTGKTEMQTTFNFENFNRVTLLEKIRQSWEDNIE
jgi:hypothetical protein